MSAQTIPSAMQPPPPTHSIGLATVSALVRELRPRQWIKNLIVLAPLLFSRRALMLESAERSLLVLVGYCLLASSIYVLNDIIDCKRDQQHPVKKLRPIASGQLSIPLAIVTAGSLLLMSLAVFSGLSAPVLGCAVAYVALQVAYTLVLKHLVIVDVLCIAAGFVLRVMTGALAISVPVSSWLYLCTFLLALFLGFAKRRAELVLLEEGAGNHRANLLELSLPILDQFLGVLSSATVVTYALYTMSEETVRRAGGEWMMLSIPCVVFGIFRYLFLVHRRNEGGSTEKLLMSDVPIIVDVLLFGTIACAVLYR